MKTLLFILLIAASFLSCSKRTDDSGPPYPPPSFAWYRAFSSPTCDDSTDEGHFEHWNDSETKYIISHDNPEIEDTSYHISIKLINRSTIVNSPNPARAYFEFRTSKPVMFATEMYRDSANSWAGGGICLNSGFNQLVAGQEDPSVKDGCYRVYCLCLSITNDSTGYQYKSVVYKTHFDVSITHY